MIPWDAPAAVSKNFIPAFIALIILGALGASTLDFTVSVQPKSVDIAVEHADPLSLELDMSMLNGKGIMEIASDGNVAVLISVPSNWQRGEVRNAKLEQVTSEPEMLGYTRWAFPPHASITYKIPETPISVLMHNPSKIPLKVSYTLVDLETEEVTKDVLLIKDEALTLW